MPQPTLLGVPYDGGSSFLRGAAEAPPRIREELDSPASGWRSELGVDFADRLGDAGDLTFAADANPRVVIEAGVAQVLERGDCPIILGGDHSITYPALRAFPRLRPAFEVLQIDAHPDLYDEFEGDRYSHACPFARIMEERLAARLVQVGIRASNEHQSQQASRFGVRVVSMGDWSSGKRQLDLRLPVYLSVDLDGLDPAFAPGVSHREPGGLSVRDVIGIIHDLPVPIIGADVVEYNPRQDVSGLTACVAAKFVKEIVGRVISSG